MSALESRRIAMKWAGSNSDRLNSQSQLKAIEQAGSTRATRLQVMNRLGIPSERPSLFDPDRKDPDSMLAFLMYKRTEMSSKYGPGHPDMVALNNQIKALMDEIEKRGGPPDDELDRHKRKLENEHAAIDQQLNVLNQALITDENKATKMQEIQTTIEKYKADYLRDEGILREKVREYDRVTDTKRSAATRSRT